jgi:hypothetical protein
MRLNDIFQFLVPKNNEFFPLFDGQSKCIVQSANLLSELITKKTDEEREEIFRKIKEVENEADEYTHKIYQELGDNFITPFDREDIHTMASYLDDVVDNIYTVAQCIQWYKPKPKKISEEFKNFIVVINKMAKEVEVAITLLSKFSKNRERILQACIKLNTYENEADRIYYSFMSQLFENSSDEHILEIIKNKDIIQKLEKCADSAEDVSDIIKTILIKL